MSVRTSIFSRWYWVNRLFQGYAALGLSTGEPIDHLFIRRLEWRIIRRFAVLTRSGTICDVACGGGNWTRRLFAKSGVTIGIDLDRQAIHSAAQATGAIGPMFVCADAAWIPFAQESFDRVVSICSLEHFERGELALREMARILRQDGIAVLTVDSLSHRHGLSGQTLERYRQRHSIRRCYDLADIERMAISSGFVVEEACYVLNSWFSNYLHRIWAEWDLRGVHYHRCEMLFPVIYPLAMVSDALFGSPHSGVILAVKLRKNGAPQS